MEVKSPSGKIYVVGSEIGVNVRFKFYECQDGDNKVCILKIARKTAFNGLLDREAYLLKAMRQEAEELEKEYRSLHAGSDKYLNYQFFFPELVESFISEEQGKSRINILGFAHIAQSLSELTPIGHLIHKESVRVDPRSSAWIMGKLLKLLTFTHSQAIGLGDLSKDNILINIKEHYVTVADWTGASFNANAEEIEAETAAREIATCARNVIELLGGNLLSFELPSDPQLKDQRYEKQLGEFANGFENSAIKAHQKFYKLIRELWPSAFHAFKTYNR